jgi:hypothetical protein
MDMTKTLVLVLSAILTAGCVGNPQLAPRPGGNPEQVDLSGRWMLRNGSERAVSNEQTIRIPPPAGIRGPTYQRPRARKSRSNGSALRVFLLSGRSLKVTQTDYGLFFSFDRAIVEEYNFGENRKVSVGPIEGQRVSGWDGRAFVTETMDADGNVLTELWRLEEGGDLLVRDVSIGDESAVEFSTQQVFVRR